MLGIFRKKSEFEVLNKKYKTLMEEYYHLSKVDRKASDVVYAEAQEILKRMDDMVEK